MKEELQNELAEHAEMGREGILRAVEFLKTQAPEVVRELLWYKGIEAAFWVVFCGFCLWVMWFPVWRRMPGWCNDRNGWDRVEVGPLPELVWGAASLFFLLPGLGYGFDVLQILIAPRVYLIEYVSNLVN